MEDELFFDDENRIPDIDDILHNDQLSAEDNTEIEDGWVESDEDDL